jgi:hypothetical protein
MNENRVENQSYFPVHILLVVIGVCWYLTAIGWLIWRIMVGGPFALALGAVVIMVLLCIMFTACGSALVIALEGRSEERTRKPTPTQPGTISTDRWTIQNPLERRGSF